MLLFTMFIQMLMFYTCKMFHIIFTLLEQIIALINMKKH